MLALYSVMALVAASLCGWMLSGSPVPLALSATIVILAFALKRLVQNSPWAQLIVTIVSSILFGIIEWHLFRSGQALVMRAETPGSLHIALSLLWGAAMLAIWDSSRTAKVSIAIGISGGIFLAASTAATVLYDYSAWLVFPIAATPFAIFLKSLVSHSRWKIGPGIAVFASLLLVVSGILYGSVNGTSYLYSKFGVNGNTDEEFAPRRPTDIGSGSGGMDGSSRKIPREGNVVFNHKIRLYVKPHDPKLLAHWAKGPLYFRTATLTKFESDEVISPIRSGVWLYDADDGEEDSMVRLLTSNRARSYQYSVFLDQGGSMSIPLANGTKSILAKAVYEFADNWFQLSPPKEVPLFRFTAQAGIPPASNKLDLAKAAPENLIYLNLPPSPLSGRVRKLTETFDQKNPLAEIQNYLTRKTEYSLTFSTPEKMSVIENFLFGDRNGHCEHYGAATVLMLRTMGVPARLAYGYTGGSVDRKKSLFAFRDSDFHTWSEVLTKDRGWVVFDTVPRVKEAASKFPVTAKVPAVKVEDYHNFSEFDLSENISQPWMERSLDEVIAFLSRNFLPSLLIILGLIGIAFWRLRMKKSAHKPDSASDRNSQASFQYPPYLRELQRFGKSRGISHSRSMTWREFESELSTRIELIPEVSRGIAYYYAVQFAGRERDPAFEQKLEDRFRNWATVCDLS